MVGAAAGLVGKGRLPGGPGTGAGTGGAGRGGAEAVRGGDDGGEGPGAAGADGADGVVPRRHVPLRHRVPPRTLRLAGGVRAAAAPPQLCVYIYSLSLAALTVGGGGEIERKSKWIWVFFLACDPCLFSFRRIACSPAGLL